MQTWVSSCGLVRMGSHVLYSVARLTGRHAGKLICCVDVPLQDFDTRPQRDMPDLGARMHTALSAELQSADQVRSSTAAGGSKARAM